jgi:uncharacterized protein YdhG (YjbR/CyaY superfamily)
LAGVIFVHENLEYMDHPGIPGNIDEYIASYSPEIQEKLQQMRQVIRKAAPAAEEKISYRMPAFTLSGMLVYFAAHTNHLGFYPFTSAIKAFSHELSRFHTSRGGIRFPYRDPLPVDLIARIIEFRVKENTIRAEMKKLNKRAGRK